MDKQEVQVPLRRIEVHVLQDIPPSRLNRDIQGFPKTALYGGHLRLRVSSQAWKRAMREYLRRKGVSTAYRTRLFPALLRETLADLEDGEALARLVGAALFSGEEEKTNTVLFVSPKEVEALAQVVRKHLEALRKLLKEEEARREKERKELLEESERLNRLIARTPPEDEARKKAERDLRRIASRLEALEGWAYRVKLPAGLMASLKEPFSRGLGKEVDLALFGRMLAEMEGAGREAAMRVAHAIGVEPYRLFIDHVVTTDDLAPHSGFLGEVPMGSSTVYRYGVIELAHLQPLGERALEGALLGVEAFVRAFPRGGSVHAPFTLPFLVFVVADAPGPLSLLGAFRRPVLPQVGEDVGALAAQRLLRHWAAHRALLGASKKALLLDPMGLLEEEFPGVKRVASLEGLLEELRG